MRHVPRLFIMSVGLGVLAAVCVAQQPKRKAADTPKASRNDGPANSSTADSIVARMMAFDKNKDGKLARDEITDPRLLRLFDRADTSQDGVVTREELVAVATVMAAENAADDRGPRDGFGPPGGGPGPRGGPGGADGPGERGPRGSGGRGPGSFGGPPQPGQILPPFIQDQLSLTADQKKQLDELQKEVDAKLAKILTDEQKRRLREMPPPSGPGRPPGGPNR